jgi:hypothetical protein
MLWPTDRRPHMEEKQSHMCIDIEVISAVQAILAAPMGVVHLMDMMMDMEALRNEVLLLLIGLTHFNQSIQQIAAFEGAFERLLNIVR